MSRPKVDIRALQSQDKVALVELDEQLVRNLQRDVEQKRREEEKSKKKKAKRRTTGGGNR
jgi:hypothetical protein